MLRFSAAADVSVDESIRQKYLATAEQHRAVKRRTSPLAVAARRAPGLPAQCTLVMNLIPDTCATLQYCAALSPWLSLAGREGLPFGKPPRLASHVASYSSRLCGD
jgi:hypothetical protein